MTIDVDSVSAWIVAAVGSSGLGALALRVTRRIIADRRREYAALVRERDRYRDGYHAMHSAAKELGIRFMAATGQLTEDYQPDLPELPPEAPADEEDE